MAYKRATSRVDREIARLGQGPHGVFSAGQLRAAGVGRAVLTDRLRTRALHRLHRGVYSVVPPHVLRIEGRWLAAVLACGPGAVLSHMDAGALWELMGLGSGAIHITVPGNGGRRKRDGLIVHRSRTLPPSQTTLRRGVPVTGPGRTLSDLRRILHPARMPAVLARAEKLRLDVGYQPDHPPDPDRTELERRMLALCRRFGLPRPETQVVIGPYTVDFLWPDRRLVVEVDGWETHGSRSAFESDRARDADLKVIGYDVVRFTWRQVCADGPEVAGIVRALLGR